MLCLYIDTVEGDLYGDADAIMRTMQRSHIPVEVHDVAKLIFPRVMRGLVRNAGFERLPVIMSVEDERKLRGIYFSVCDERGLSE